MIHFIGLFLSLSSLVLPFSRLVIQTIVNSFAVEKQRRDLKVIYEKGRFFFSGSLHSKKRTKIDIMPTVSTKICYSSHVIYRISRHHHNGHDSFRGTNLRCISYSPVPAEETNGRRIATEEILLRFWHAWEWRRWIVSHTLQHDQTEERIK